MNAPSIVKTIPNVISPCLSLSEGTLPKKIKDADNIPTDMAISFIPSAISLNASAFNFLAYAFSTLAAPLSIFSTPFITLPNCVNIFIVDANNPIPKSCFIVENTLSQVI